MRLFFCILTSFLVLSFFKSLRHSARYYLDSHCGFNLHFPKCLMMLNIFSCVYLPTSEPPQWNICPFSIWIGCFSLLSFENSLLLLCQICGLQIFSPVYSLSLQTRSLQSKSNFFFMKSNLSTLSLRDYALVSILKTLRILLHPKDFLFFLKVL